MIKILLSGCNGRMGQAVARLCASSDKCEIVGGIDKNAQKLSDFPVFSTPDEVNIDADVVIDFSNSEAFNSLSEFCRKKRLPLVLCTTGLSEKQLNALTALSNEIPVLRSGNMSLGINLIMKLLPTAVKTLGDGFDVEIIEKHHNKKVDAPSGTALMLANSVAEALPYEPEYIYDRHDERKPRSKNEIGIHSIRGGTIVGDHEVIFAGQDEIIEIKHTVISREVFAVGAVRAAEFLSNVGKNGLYSMSDVMR